MRVLLFLLLPNLSYACDIPDRSAERAPIIQALKDADTYAKGRTAIAEAWAFWRKAPTPHLQTLLNSGLERIRIADYPQAITTFSAMIEDCPDFAEAYNQRAFAYFLQNDFDNAMQDIDTTLTMEPDHFGAITGKALIYMRTNQEKLAQVYFRKAVAINPWLNERHLIKPTTGDDL